MIKFILFFILVGAGVLFGFWLLYKSIVKAYVKGKAFDHDNYLDYDRHTAFTGDRYTGSIFTAERTAGLYPVIVIVSNGKQDSHGVAVGLTVDTALAHGKDLANSLARKMRFNDYEGTFTF